VKPVAIFRFSPEDGPGYFASFLDERLLPWTLFKLDDGTLPPIELEDFAGFVFMGGPMSANDDLPWIAPTVRLIRDAIGGGMPCLGHCLGGQLMSKALGGMVTTNRVKEIGWNTVSAIDSDAAHMWLGDATSSLTTFQWHGETFSIPEGAERILTSSACANQAFVIGNSLAMQCHTEMTPDMIEDWCQDWGKENADPGVESIQTPAEILAGVSQNISRLHRLADRLYGKWLEGVYPRQRAGTSRENY
jgi:GMP synthase-like glutamine amidotransferase